MGKNTQSLTSNEIHNNNCYVYLNNLKVDQSVYECLPELKAILIIKEEYNPNIKYGDLYNEILVYLENNINDAHENAKKNKDHLTALNNLVNSIFNNNYIKSIESEWIVKLVNSHDDPAMIEKAIKKHIEEPNQKTNKYHPSHQGKKSTIILNLFTFDSLFKSNLPYIKKEIDSKKPTEYFFGAMVKSVSNKQYAVYNLFQKFLEINAQNQALESLDEDNSEYNYVYFSNLKNSSGNFERKLENGLNNTLHELEDKPHLKVAVITLPAHEGLMDAHSYEKYSDTIEYGTAFKKMKDIAEGNNTTEISDFRISSALREKLFDEQINKNAKSIDTLLNASFNAMGIKNKSNLSTAQQQAVWFYFTKYELPKHVLTTLKPKGFNFSCKDAIDRGAASSLFFNLVDSFNSQDPMTQEDFIINMELRAIQVKGRGMNFHRKILWNAVHYYVEANIENLKADPQKAWLIDWRNKFCPIKGREDILQSKIDRLKNKTEHSNDALKKNINSLMQELPNISKPSKENKENMISNLDRLVTVLSKIESNPEEATIYKKELESIQLKFAKEPSFSAKALGILEIIIGIIVYLPSIGYSGDLVKDGLHRYGLYHTPVESIKTQLDTIKEIDESTNSNLPPKVE